jgi:hypothetical protein
LKREYEGGSYIEPFVKRRREEKGAGALQVEPETWSQGGRSPDRASQRSVSGSERSVKREDPDEVMQDVQDPPPPTT